MAISSHRILLTTRRRLNFLSLGFLKLLEVELASNFISSAGLSIGSKLVLPTLELNLRDELAKENELFGVSAAGI